MNALQLVAILIDLGVIAVLVWIGQRRRGRPLPERTWTILLVVGVLLVATTTLFSFVPSDIQVPLFVALVVGVWVVVAISIVASRPRGGYATTMLIIAILSVVMALVIAFLDSQQ